MIENSITDVSNQEIDSLLLEADESPTLLFEGLTQDVSLSEEQVLEADFNEDATIKTISSSEQLEQEIVGKTELEPVLQEASRTSFRFPYNVVVGTNQADDLAGTDGADIILGLDGNDFLVGLGGNDIIVGGNGNDEQFGNKGNDIIIGGAGNDSLSGGRANATNEIDTANYRFLSEAITLEAVGIIRKGSLGTDRIAGIEKIVGASGKNNAIDGSTGTSGVTSFSIDLQANKLTVNDIPGLGDVSFTVENFVDVIGTTQGDNIAGNSQNNRLDGGSGNDSLEGKNGNDDLFGGAGADTLVGGSGSDNLTGGSGGDLFQFTFSDLFNDRITDFNRAEGDRLSLSFFGSGFNEVSYDQFEFDSSTGDLSFNGQEITAIDASTGFDLRSDLAITGASIVSGEQPTTLEPSTPIDFEPITSVGGFAV